MKTVLFDEIIRIINSLDKESSFELYIPDKQLDLLKDEISKYYNDGRLAQVAVLGIDIYQYSKFPEYEQHLLPIIFDIIYDKAVKQCLATQAFIFQNHDEQSIKSNFIPTGDGGFQILSTPLHCLLMAIYFEASLREFNSYSAYPSLRHWIGSISLRYTVTLETVFSYNNNYYGPAIIRNARIISRDKLNRFLVDHDTIQWFQHQLSGIESLMVFNLSELSKASCFVGYNKDKVNDASCNIIFNRGSLSFNAINNLIVSKVGKISVKDDHLDVYSVYVQLVLLLSDEHDPSLNKPLVISLGNLNVQGISE